MNRVDEVRLDDEVAEVDLSHVFSMVVTAGRQYTGQIRPLNVEIVRLLPVKRGHNLPQVQPYQQLPAGSVPSLSGNGTWDPCLIVRITARIMSVHAEVVAQTLREDTQTLVLALRISSLSPLRIPATAGRQWRPCALDVDSSQTTPSLSMALHSSCIWRTMS